MRKVLVGVCMLSFLLVACGKSTPESRRKLYCDDVDMAFLMSRGFVKRVLKAPSTAEFPSALDSDVVSVKVDECKFKVSGYVDATNSFGAMIRTRYDIDMEFLPKENAWRGTNLKM